MPGVEDSSVVSGDEEAGYNSISKQIGHQPTDSTQASVTSNPAQGGAPEHSIVVNGQQGPEQTFLNTHHKDILDASEHGDEYDDLRLRIAVLEEKNETLEKKCKTLEKRCEAWEKKFEKLERLIRHQVEQSEEEQFCSTASTQQDPRGDIGSVECDFVVSQEASCDSKHICNVQLKDHSNQRS
eukprot:Em0017g372a